jgi:hypothetical protein
MANEWRQHPKLLGRFHPECPDDLQVVVHDGGPRMSDRSPERVWVRVRSLHADVFSGQVLNQPRQLNTVRQNTEIRFIMPDGGKYPLQVREKYLHERSDWIVHPCQKCGLSELFDAPSDLIRKIFPNTPPDAVMEMFSAFCGQCGGVQIVEHKRFNPEDAGPTK